MSRLVAQLLDQDTGKLPQFIRELGIDRAAQAVLVELRLLSNVAAASLGQHIHSSKPGHKVLSFTAGEPSEVEFERRYRGCKTDTSKIAVITEFVTVVRDARHSRRPPIDCQTKDGRLQVGREAISEGVRKIAQLRGYSERHVYRLVNEVHEYDRRHRKAA